MEFNEKMAIIIANLSKSKKVTSYNSEEISEAEAMAHGILDMEESFVKLNTEYFPKLLNANLNEDEIEDILFDVGEELRHIIYHINDMKYYNYLDKKNGAR